MNINYHSGTCASSDHISASISVPQPSILSTAYSLFYLSSFHLRRLVLCGQKPSSIFRSFVPSSLLSHSRVYSLFCVPSSRGWKMHCALSTALPLFLSLIPLATAQETTTSLFLPYFSPSHPLLASIVDAVSLLYFALPASPSLPFPSLSRYPFPKTEEDAHAQLTSPQDHTATTYSIACSRYEPHLPNGCRVPIPFYLTSGPSFMHATLSLPSTYPPLPPKK